jgi:hypothetical protein
VAIVPPPNVHVWRFLLDAWKGVSWIYLHVWTIGSLVCPWYDEYACITVSSMIGIGYV